MALTTAQIQQAYVTFFSRPADPVGLAYWQNYSGSVADLYATFAQQSEYSAAFSGLSSAQKVNVVYQNLFGRDAEASGLLYWAGQLEAGKVTVANLALAVSAGSQGTDKVTVDSRVSAATSFTAALDTAAEVLGYSGATANASAKTWLAGVTTAANLATAVAAIDTAVASTVAVGGAAGSTFTLTTSTDTLTGTAGNDTFVGDATTITSSDQVNGGAGTDTIKIYDLAAATDVPALTSVENVQLINAAAPGNALDLTGVTEMTSLVLDNPTTTDTYSINSAVSATVKNMVAGESLTLTSRATDTTADLTVEGLDAADAGTVTVNFDGALIATANIVSSGTTKNKLTFASTGAETAINVSGAAGLVLVNTATGIATFNASAATGGVEFDGSNATAASQTFTGGSGADTITADLGVVLTLNAGAGNDVVTLANPTAANLSSAAASADSINGGDGTDTLKVTAAGAVALAGDSAADRAVITNFEQLRTSTDLNASSFSIAAFGMNYLQVEAATTTADGTVSGFTSGATVEYRAAADSTEALNITMTGATNAGTLDDTLNIKLNSNLVDQANAAAAIELIAGVSGINKINVTTADRVNTDGATTRNDGYILTLENDNSVSSLTVSGDRELSFTSTASTASLATVNASALTGDLIVDLSTNGVLQGVAVTGGAGTNTITGTGYGDVIVGGARADTLTLGAGSDSATGGAGADTFVVVAADYTAASAAALAAAADSITDFAAGSDIIDWDATVVAVQNATASAGTAALNSEGFATFDAADDTLAERITAVEAGINAGGAATDGQFAVFTYGSDTYVFISEGTNGVGAGDALIKLVGVSGLSDTTVNGDNNLVIA